MKRLDVRRRRIRPVNAPPVERADGTRDLPLPACDCDNYHPCSCDHDVCGSDINVCVADLDGSGMIDTEAEVCAAFGWG